MTKLAVVVSAIAIGLIFSSCSGGQSSEQGSSQKSTATSTSASGGNLVQGPHQKSPLTTPRFAAGVVYADQSSLDLGTEISAVPSPSPRAAPSPLPADPAVIAPSHVPVTPASPLTSTSSPGPAADLGRDLSECSSANLCIVYATGWLRLGPDRGRQALAACPKDHPYLVMKGHVDPVWAWSRDHDTVSVWVDFPKPDGNGNMLGIYYGAQNWNTVWGDAWHYQIFLACSAYQSDVD